MFIRFALRVTTADEQDRAQVSELAKRAQAETGETVKIAFVDQGALEKAQPMRLMKSKLIVSLIIVRSIIAQISTRPRREIPLSAFLATGLSASSRINFSHRTRADA
jgi:hypothetical protein